MRITKLIAKEIHFELNHETRILSGNIGEAHKLGGKEFLVLGRLSETPGKPVSTDDLLDTAWKYSPNAQLSYVARTISDLRRKLGDTELTKRFIETADSGYVLIADCKHRETFRAGKPAADQVPPTIRAARMGKLLDSLVDSSGSQNLQDRDVGEADGDDLKMQHMPGPTQTPAQLLIGIEGMTLQLVGELIFGDRKTRACIPLCNAVYLRALEDFVFACVYGTKCLTSDKLPAGRGTPNHGEELVGEFGDLFERMDVRGISTAKELLNDAGIQNVVATELRSLDKRASYRQSHIDSVVIREASRYLGNDPSLQTENGPFKYAKDDDYFSCPSVEKEMHEGTVNRLMDCLGEYCPGKSIAARNDFIRRFWLTHLTIGRWYQTSTVKCWRLPVTTRAGLYATDVVDAQSVVNLKMSLALDLFSKLPRHLIGLERTRILRWLIMQAKDERYDNARRAATELNQAIQAGAPASAIDRLGRVVEALAPKVQTTDDLLYPGTGTLIERGHGKYGKLTTLYEIFPELVSTDIS